MNSEANFFSILNNIAEDHFNRKLGDSKLLKTFITIIRKTIKARFDSQIGNDEEGLCSEEEMKRIIRPIFIDEIGDVKHIIYSHSIIIRTKHTVSDVDELLFFLEQNWGKYKLLHLMSDSSDDLWIVYDKIMSDYQVLKKSFQRRNLPFNPASIDSILNNEDTVKFQAFEKIVMRRYPKTTKLLVDGLVYSLLWMFHLPRDVELVLQVGILPELPSNICGLVLVMCYCNNFGVISLEEFEMALKYIENRNPFTSFSEMMKNDDPMPLTKFLIGLGKTLIKKMETIQPSMEELKKQIFAISERSKNFVTREELLDVTKQLAEKDVKLEEYEKKLQSQEEKLSITNEELSTTKEKLVNMETTVNVLRTIISTNNSRHIVNNCKRLGEKLEINTVTMMDLDSQVECLVKECKRKDEKIAKLESVIVSLMTEKQILIEEMSSVFVPAKNKITI